MFLIRVLGLLVAITIGVSVLLYMVGGDRRYLRFAWQIFRYAVFAVAFVLTLLLLERVLVIV